jgi:CubicO group peptidase (beta-lactamase class C family)
MDQAMLELMTAIIEDMHLPIDGVVVRRHGEVVFEAYPNPKVGPEEMHLLYSVTKSFTSALIGIAIDQGFLEGVDQKVIDFFAEWEIENLDARKQALTIENLLTMTCGFEWEGPDDGLHTWGDALRSGNPVKYVLNQPMASDPGTEWIYNGGCSHILSAILTRTTGRSTLAFAQEYLFEPLGITDVHWPRDPQGIYFGGQDIWLTPRDMSKFGQLFLNGGAWEGQQIIPSDWVAKSTVTHMTHWDGGYGYHWWTYPDSGIYYASGAFEQRIMIIPDYDMVVVFTSDPLGADLGSGEWGESPPAVDWLLGRFVLPACDTYAAQTYVNYGFSLDIPMGMQSRELGKEFQGRTSKDSGLIQFHFGGSPYENLGAQWDTVQSTPNLESALEEFSVVVSALGVALNLKGDPSIWEVEDHEVLVQSFEVMDGEYTLPGVVGAWYCDETKRVFVVYFCTIPGVEERIDPQSELLQYLETFECHP